MSFLVNIPHSPLTRHCPCNLPGQSPPLCLQSPKNFATNRDWRESHFLEKMDKYPGWWWGPFRLSRGKRQVRCGAGGVRGQRRGGRAWRAWPAVPPPRESRGFGAAGGALFPAASQVSGARAGGPRDRGAGESARAGGWGRPPPGAIRGAPGPPRRPPPADVLCGRCGRRRRPRWPCGRGAESRRGRRPGAGKVGRPTEPGASGQRLLAPPICSGLWTRSDFRMAEERQPQGPAPSATQDPAAGSGETHKDSPPLRARDGPSNKPQTPGARKALE